MATPLHKKGVFEVLQDPNTHAIVLLTICLVMYGDNPDIKESIFEVDPLLLDKWLEEDFETRMHEFNENKLRAVLATMPNDSFYNDLQTFKSVCKTLFCGDFGVNDSLFNSNPTLPEMLWGIYEMSIIQDDEVTKTEVFSAEIKNFINIIINHTGEEYNDTTIEEAKVNVIQDNINEIKEQFIKIGLQDIPAFPPLELDV